MINGVFTSESVTEGHPDKVADRISDSILDAVLAQDKEGHVACETFVTTGLAVVGGEIRARAELNVPKIVRAALADIGYLDEHQIGFGSESVGVLNAIQPQSSDIDTAVSKKQKKEDQGAGDQGMMFGFACDETPELMPLPIALCHRLALRLSKVRKNGQLAYLRPDGKTQVSVEYDQGRPVRITNIVVSTHHARGIDQGRIRRDVWREVVRPTVKELPLPDENHFFCNPSGKFEIGGPAGDTGLTGRKIIVDTYGGMARHGGGAFSGKDPSKVDRSAAYAARWVAKNVVAAKLAKRVEVRISYAIGRKDPTSIGVETYTWGTGAVNEKRLSNAIRSVFDLTPWGIIKGLDLKRPIYQKTSAYGHFGRNEKEFTWEKTGKVGALRKAAGL